MALHIFRVIAYIALFLFSTVLFGLCCARIHYTRNLSTSDPLNGGQPFFDPIVAELLFTSLMTMFWAPTIAHAVHTRHDYHKRYLFSFLFEVAGLGVFFVFWLVGAAVATSYWGNLHWCHQFRACRLLTALLAFAWMGWIMILVLLVVSILFAYSNKAFHEPLHGRWDPRESHYRDSRGIFPQMRASAA